MSISFSTKKNRFILCVFVTLGLAGHLAWTFLADTHQTSMLKRGDFPSFYSAGMIVRQGLAAQLYDTRMLAYVQNLYWPSLAGNHISFPYPPFVAGFLCLFAFFSPLLSKWLFNLAMGFTLWAAVGRMRKIAPTFAGHPFLTFTFLFSCFPVSFGILGSQFTALNLFLFAAILEALSRNSAAGETWAGIFLGLWFFKPQYALPLMLFFSLARCWKIVRPALVVALAYFFLGALVQGFTWPVIWLKASWQAAAIDFPHNDFNMISLAGFFHALAKPLGKTWIHSAAALSFVLSLLMGAVAAKLFWNAGKILDREQKSKTLLFLIAYAAPVLLLASPHALFYDFGLCIFAAARFFRLESDKSYSAFLAVTALASFCVAFKNLLPFQPLIFFVISLYFFFNSLLFSGNFSCVSNAGKAK